MCPNLGRMTSVAKKSKKVRSERLKTQLKCVKTTKYVTELDFDLMSSL
jgi:hypothetical protein